MNTTALLYALGTVLCWGLYSVLLHKGSLLMSSGPPDTGSRMKAFLLVGVAYFIVGILGPLVVMKMQGTPMNFPRGGLTWSLLAGLAGAIGAFFLLMALSSGTSPGESKALVLLVPAIVFAGAPIINAIVSITKDGVWGETRFPFYLGILLAAAGVAMVMQYRPLGHAPAKSPGTPAPAVSGGNSKTSTISAVSLPAGYTDVTTRTWFVS